MSSFQLVLNKKFFLHLAETTDPREKCIICGDDVLEIWPHVKVHMIARNERKLLSYYKLKQDGSRLRLVWTGYREKVDVPLNKFDEAKILAQKLENKERNLRKALTTFREPQPPKIVKEVVNSFLNLQTNVSRKFVAKRLQDAGYNLEQKHVILIYNKVKSAFNNHLR